MVEGGSDRWREWASSIPEFLQRKKSLGNRHKSGVEVKRWAELTYPPSLHVTDGDCIFLPPLDKRRMLLDDCVEGQMSGRDIVS